MMKQISRHCLNSASEKNIRDHSLEFAFAFSGEDAREIP
jgi:hypothetical protein